MSDITFWGVTASPYQLKMQATADYAGLSWQRWPDQARTLPALRMFLRLRNARGKQTIQRFPFRQPLLDEYPAVPFYTLNGSQFHYDSSGLALHLEQFSLGESLLPKDPGMRFICQLIDEAFDEFGLYMVHHNRWVTSAKTNRMGLITSQEMRKLVPFFLRSRFAQSLPIRQVRRLPYLFSVAPANYDTDLTDTLTPPAKDGFPPTHALLDKAWRQYLSALENILDHQPYLLGDQFTLADASAYGQLGMNLADGKTAQVIEDLAPRSFQWLSKIHAGEHKTHSGELYLSEHLAPLLAIISETFIPLMQQNEKAYLQACKKGQTRFNEAAFDAGESLYDGQLMNLPFRAVIKSFQVPVWRDLCASWRGLSVNNRASLRSAYPVLTDSQFTTDGD